MVRVCAHLARIPVPLAVEHLIADKNIMTGHDRSRRERGGEGEREEEREREKKPPKEE